MLLTQKSYFQETKESGGMEMPLHTARFYQGEPGLECIFTRLADMTYPAHNHISCFAVAAVLSGQIRVRVGGAAGRRYKKGEFFIARPYEPHSVAADGECALACLCVRREFARMRLGGARLDAARRFLGNAAAKEGADAALFDSLIDAASALDLLPPWQGEKNDRPIAAAMRRIEERPEEAFCLGEMASRAGLSRYYFIRRFKRAAGLTPHQFQLQNRVRKAQRGVLSLPTLAEAAYDAGFFDQSHMIRQFKRAVGLTPSRYRDACVAAADESAQD